MSAATLYVSGMGWVLPGSVGSGSEPLAAAWSTAWRPEDNALLAAFSAKPYLESVKGYLDPASSFCLAACALALGGPERKRPSGLRERAGLCTLTRYGATLSGFRFYEQLLRKGPRYASPLIFPHGYANTPGSLAAIEFEFGGPHMVYYGDQDVREGLEFAAARFADRTANELLLTAFESAEGDALPDGVAVMHGAVALHLVADPPRNPLLTIQPEGIRETKPPSAARGMTAALLDLVRNLTANPT
ncbi:MAG: hypothetical protein JXR77_04215 [Lentisphaeria bacterium]|nr:hypothetical protein [Lentisphaeria bacterium]